MVICIWFACLDNDESTVGVFRKLSDINRLKQVIKLRENFDKYFFLFFYFQFQNAQKIATPP